MGIETIILSEFNQTVNDKHHMISPICGILKKKKKDTNELFSEQKQTHRLKNLWLPKGTDVGG